MVPCPGRIASTPTRCRRRLLCGVPERRRTDIGTSANCAKGGRVGQLGEFNSTDAFLFFLFIFGFREERNNSPVPSDPLVFSSGVGQSLAARSCVWSTIYLDLPTPLVLVPLGRASQATTTCPLGWSRCLGSEALEAKVVSDAECFRFSQSALGVWKNIV